MLSCDTNLLFYSLEASCPEHSAARNFLSNQSSNHEFALSEFVLTELYVLLRNPVVARRPLDAPAAAAIIRQLRTNPKWMVVDHPGPVPGIMETLWSLATQPRFARRRVYDARLALTLRHHGVTDFATANIRNFQDFGFTRLWNPLETKDST